MLDILAFVMRRTTRYWQVLAILAFGVVLATALLASAPVLTNTVVEFGMRRTLLDADPLEANIRLTTRAWPTIAEYRDTHVRVQELVLSYVGRWVETTIPTANSRWLFPWAGQELLVDRRISLQFYDRAYGAGQAGPYEHTRLVAGYWPDSEASPDNVLGVVSEGMAREYGLNPGDRLGLSIKEDAQEPDLWVAIAGVVRARDPRERYWFGPRSPLLSQHSAHYDSQYSILVSPETFFAAARGPLESSQVDLSWHVLVEPGAIVLDDVPRLRGAIGALETTLAELPSPLRLETGLSDTLAAFSAKAVRIRAPLYFLIATVMVLALYYVTMDAALSLRQFQREFAVLHSRGASGWQLFRIQLFEAGLVVTVALLSGPGLGLTIVRALATLGPLADVRATTWSLWLPQASWWAGLIGAGACLTSLLAPVPNALRKSIVAHQQTRARADQPPWWQRYYVDVFVLLAGLILIFRLRIYGSILGGTAGQPQVDWLLLLSPLALLLGSAAILLRVFPAILNLLAGWVCRERGIVATLSLWRAARDPAHIARLVLLLTLAMALGLFSSGLGATLDRNERDQSQYTVGSDVRVIDPPPGTRHLLLSLPEVQALAAARREEGTIAIQSEHGYPTFELLAVEPTAMGETARFRADFAARPVQDLLASLVQADSPQPLLMAPHAYDGLGLWCWLPPEMRSLVARLRVDAKAVTADGLFERFRLRLDESQSGDEDGWYYFEGQLARRGQATALHSVWFSTRLASYQAQIGRIALGELLAIDTQDEAREVWTAFPTSNWHIYGRDAILEQDDAAASAAGAWSTIVFEQGEMRTGTWYGLQLRDGSAPLALPALVSPAFQEQSQAHVGDRVGTWVDSEPLELAVVGVVEHFPTLYEEQGDSFVVTALDPLLRHLNSLDPEPVYENEIHVRLAPDSPEGRVATLLPDLEVWDAESVRKAIKSDPLALGLRSVTLFGYLLTAVLSLAGFGTHFYMSTREHGRTYAVLRALGLSAGQLYGMLLFEQALLILSGLGLGTVLGLLLNRLTLPGLPLSLGGRPPVPPFLAQTDWRAVGTVYLTLALAFLMSLALATGMLWRAKLHRLLRVDEE